MSDPASDGERKEEYIAKIVKAMETSGYGGLARDDIRWLIADRAELVVEVKALRARPFTIEVQDRDARIEALRRAAAWWEAELRDTLRAVTVECDIDGVRRVTTMVLRLREQAGRAARAAPSAPAEPVATEIAAAYYAAPAERDAATTGDAEQLAQRFHETYERLAPSFGYQTREASAKPWVDVPEQNRRLMIAVCGEILAHPAPPVAALTEIDWVNVKRLLAHVTAATRTSERILLKDESWYRASNTTKERALNEAQTDCENARAALLTEIAKPVASLSAALDAARPWSAYRAGFLEGYQAGGSRNVLGYELLVTTAENCATKYAEARALPSGDAPR